MKSLFLRIFLSFWLVMGVTLAASFGMSTLLQSSRGASLADLDPDELARDARAAARQGEAALRDWSLAAGRRHALLGVYVVDEADRDINGLALSPLSADRLRAYRARHARYAALAAARGRPLPDAAAAAVAPPDAARSTWWNVRVLHVPDGRRFHLLFDPFTESAAGDWQHSPFSWLLLLFCFVVSAPVCWLLARHISVPVQRLQEGARKLADGDLSVRVGGQMGGRRDELAVLARDFDVMAARTRALLDMKETLLRDVSHELRSPLTRLRLALGLARRNDDRLSVQLDRIERECLHLDALIGRILDLARLRDMPPERLERFDLADVVSKIAEDARFEAQDKQVEVRVEPAGAALPVEADWGELASAVDNVVRNALRFSAAGQRVSIVLRREPGYAVAEVLDQGPGVPDAALPRLFEPFFRVAAARDRGTGGVGLGLAITAAALRQMGGMVDAANRPQGGLAVRLSLPLARG